MRDSDLEPSQDGHGVPASSVTFRTGIKADTRSWKHWLMLIF